jgi:putative transposase
MADARDRIEQGRTDDNKDRPHSALGTLTPRAFAIQAHQARKVAKNPDQNWGAVRMGLN